jgi:hypothetical protein
MSGTVYGGQVKQYAKTSHLESNDGVQPQKNQQTNNVVNKLEWGKAGMRSS